MSTMAEQFEQMKTRIPELETALAESKAVSIESDAKLVKVTAEKAKIEADALTATATAKAESDKLTAEAKIVAEKILALESKVKEQADKLALAPFADAAEGKAKAVADGGEAASAATVDHKAELKKLQRPGNSREAIAYYRKFRKEIDA